MKYLEKFLNWLFLSEEVKEFRKLQELRKLVQEAIKEENIEAFELLKEIFENMECTYYNENKELLLSICNKSLDILKSKITENASRWEDK